MSQVSDEAELAISADGRFVVFESEASNLVAGDANGAIDVFIRDRVADTTDLVSRSSSALQGNGGSSNPTISADGRLVAFQSNASNLVSGDTNGRSDVFVRNLLTGTTTRASESSGGAQGDAASSDPAISSDGASVAFVSQASNLVTGDSNAAYDVFVKDFSSGAVDRVSVSSTGTQSDATSSEGPFGSPSISENGDIVAFRSRATNLVVGDTNSAADIFVRDRLAGITTRVSVSSGGLQGNGFSGSPSLSLDGRFVAFQSSATNLVPSDNFSEDVFVHDRHTGATQLVSETGSSTHSGSNASISADGRFVAYASSDTLLPGDTNFGFDVFVRDRSSGSTERVSDVSPGTAANGASRTPVISGDATLVVFQSFATDLVGDDTNGWSDVFVRERELPTGTSTLDVTKDGTGDGTVTSTPAGIDCGSTCSASFDSGTSVTLHADPDATSTFDGWTGGGCSGTADCTVTMDQARSVTATFTGLPVSVDLTPFASTNPVGTDHTVTATVRNAAGGPVAGAEVVFKVVGSISGSGSCTTAASGTCSFTYTGPDLPGADAISAFADINGNGTRQAPEEPLGEATKAWLLPTSTPGQTTGGGQIPNPDGDNEIAFGFNAKSTASGLKGEGTLVDIGPNHNIKIKLLNVTSMVQTGTHATVFGNATINGTATTYRVDVDDLAEPGRGMDRFKIRLATGYLADGILARGNIQVHA